MLAGVGSGFRPRMQWFDSILDNGVELEVATVPVLGGWHKLNVWVKFERKGKVFDHDCNSPKNKF